MGKQVQDLYDYIQVIKKLDSYMQHKLSDWDFKELVRTIAIEIENNRKLAVDLNERLKALEEKVGIEREE